MSRNGSTERDDSPIPIPDNPMKAFNVWVSAKGDVCRVRVDGLKNTHWLLDRLSRLFVFKTSESLREDADSASFSFSIIHSFQMNQPRFERLLVSIPEVHLTRVVAKTQV